MAKRISEASDSIQLMTESFDPEPIHDSIPCADLEKCFVGGQRIGDKLSKELDCSHALHGNSRVGPQLADATPIIHT